MPKKKGCINTPPWQLLLPRLPLLCLSAAAHRWPPWPPAPSPDPPTSRSARAELREVKIRCFTQNSLRREKNNHNTRKNSDSKQLPNKREKERKYIVFTIVFYNRLWGPKLLVSMNFPTKATTPSQASERLGGGMPPQACCLFHSKSFKAVVGLQRIPYKQKISGAFLRKKYEKIGDFAMDLMILSRILGGSTSAATFPPTALPLPRSRPACSATCTAFCAAAACEAPVANAVEAADMPRSQGSCDQATSEINVDSAKDGGKKTVEDS